MHIEPEPKKMSRKERKEAKRRKELDAAARSLGYVRLNQRIERDQLRDEIRIAVREALDEQRRTEKMEKELAQWKEDQEYMSGLVGGRVRPGMIMLVDPFLRSDMHGNPADPTKAHLDGRYVYGDDPWHGGQSWLKLEERGSER